MASQNRRLKEMSACAKVVKAIKDGEMEKLEACELCGTSTIIVTDKKGKSHRRNMIVAHHWRGYEDDAATDIWWLCTSCNCKLRGPNYHNGTVTKEQARKLIQTGSYWILHI